MSDDRTDLTLPRAPREYLAIIWHRLWLVIGVTAVVFGVGLGRSVHQAKVYRASGQIVVESNDPNALQTQMRIIESSAVHAFAARKVPGIGTVQTQQAGLGDIITVSADDPSPAVAATTVNATIDAYVSYVAQQANRQFLAASAAIRDRMKELQNKIDALNVQIQSGTPPRGDALAAQRDALINEQSALQQRLDGLQFDAAAGTTTTVVARATAPTSPISPNVRADALIALGAGLLLGIALAFAVEYFASNGAGGSSDTPNSEELLRRATANVTLMGVIPTASPTVSEVISLSTPDSGAAKSYRSLHNAASFMGLDRGRCLAVTSAPDRDGKTETLANLAVLLALAGRRVIVVDCDLRKPRVHEFFGLANETGFTSVMHGSPLAEALQRVPNVDHLYALTSGPPTDDPAAMLASDRCGDMLGSLLVGGTLVLVDTPPMLPITDALTVATTAPVDGVVLVATPTSDAREHLRQALESLNASGAPQVGVVLTTPEGTPDQQSGEPAQSRWSRQRHRRRHDPSDDSATWKGVMRAVGYSGVALASSNFVARAARAPSSSDDRPKE